MSLFLDRYEIIAELGRGGMGVVWKAQDHKLNRIVAIKVMHTVQSMAQLRRFQREAEAVAQLRHPGIIQIFDVGTSPDGKPYIVMDFVDGDSLKEMVDEDLVSPEKALILIKQVADALTHIHDRGILHRDIKPHNIVVDSKTGIPVLLDFGLARERDKSSSLTEDGSVLGTVAYMPPEQADGQVVGERADIYSLGATLYYVLAGRAPFQGDRVALMKQVFMDSPIAPSKFSKNVPKALEDACLRCMAKDSEERPQSAEAFSAELSALLEQPPSPAPKMGPGTWITAALILFSIVVSAFLFFSRAGLVTIEGGEAGMEVYLNNEPIGRFGKDGRFKYSFPPGQHTLQIEPRRGDQFKYAITVEAGDTLRRTLPYFVTLNIIAPSGTSVHMGKELLGECDDNGQIQSKLRPGRVELEFQLNHSRYIESLSLEGGSNVVRRFDLNGRLKVVVRAGLKATILDSYENILKDREGRELKNLTVPAEYVLPMGLYELELKGEGVLGDGPKTWRKAFKIRPKKLRTLKIHTGFRSKLDYGGYWADPVFFDCNGDGYRDIFALCASGDGTRHDRAGAQVVAFSGFNGEILWQRPQNTASYYGRLVLHKSALGPAIVVGECIDGKYQTAWLSVKDGRELHSIDGMSKPQGDQEKIAEMPVGRFDLPSGEGVVLVGREKFYIFDNKLRRRQTIDLKTKVKQYNHIYRTPMTLSLDPDKLVNDLFVVVPDGEEKTKLLIFRNLGAGANPTEIKLQSDGGAIPFDNNSKLLTHFLGMGSTDGIVIWDLKSEAIIDRFPFDGHVKFVFPYKRGTKNRLLISPTNEAGAAFTPIIIDDTGKRIHILPGGYPITLSRGKKTYIVPNARNGRYGPITICDPTSQMDIVWKSKNQPSLNRIRAVDLTGNGQESLLIHSNGRLIHFTPPLD
ncbi:MAG: protein kinase [Planctomycetota bacterium]|nr:protein kinase [Planctomycetota bacterium]